MNADRDDPIEIVDYDPAWPAQFEVAREELIAVLAPWLLAIQHIGSTAVQGLAAKPVIDLLVGVRSLAASDAIVAALEAVGYEYVPAFEVELPFRRYFRRVQGHRRTHQVHLVERTNADWWDRHVGFRDWLRDHDEDRDAYAVLKRSLADDHRHDREAYTEAKSDFIRAIEVRVAALPA